MTVASAAKANRAIGAMFLFAFGTAWLAGGDVIGIGGASWTLAPILLAGLALFAIAWRRFDANRAARAAQVRDARTKRIARVFRWVNAGQWVLVLVVVNVLANTGLGAWIVPAIAFIVGLHFVPLAVVMGYRPHHVTGVALMLAAVVVPFVAATGPRSALLPIATGVILWASAIYALAAGAPAPSQA